MGPIRDTETDRAILHDPDSGTQEQAAFFDVAGQRLLGFTHLPPAAAMGGVVICSPIKAEFVKNYRREVMLARALAKRGVAAQRFHYRGAGNSDGDAAHLTFDTMRDDARAALDALRRTTGVTKVAFLGTRVGALVAAAATGGVGDAPLALWAPVIDGDRYFREVNRARLMRALKLGTPDRSGIGDAIEEFGRADVIGFSIDRPLYDSLRGATLVGALGETPRPLFVAQILPTTRPSAENRQLVDGLAARGWDVELHVTEAEIGWWFEEERPTQLDISGDVIDDTARWLVDRLRADSP